MRTHPRISKTVKWLGPVVTALLVLVWFANGWEFGPNRSWVTRLLRDPLWCLAAGMAALTIVAWRRDALARRREWARILNRCAKCNYNRIGLAPRAVCPYCGTPEQPATDSPR